MIKKALDREREWILAGEKMMEQKRTKDGRQKAQVIEEKRKFVFISDIVFLGIIQFCFIVFYMNCYLET